MKERAITLMFKHTVSDVAADNGGIFWYKIPDPPLVQYPGKEGKFPAGKRPFDVILCAGARVWALEFKMMRRKKPWTMSEVRKKIESGRKNRDGKKSEHQYEALRDFVAAGGVTAHAMVLAYNESTRSLFCYHMIDGRFSHFFEIGRQGPDFDPRAIRQRFFGRGL